MKKFLLIAIGCIASIFIANAQKFAFIDMEYIMENIPAYQEANKALNTLSQKYQNTLEAKAKEAETGSQCHHPHFGPSQALLPHGSGSGSAS